MSTGEAPVVTLHATVDAATEQQSVLRGILARLRERHAITHATVQLETPECVDDHDHRCHRV